MLYKFLVVEASLLDCFIAKSFVSFISLLNKQNLTVSIHYFCKISQQRVCCFFLLRSHFHSCFLLWELRYFSIAHHNIHFVHEYFDLKFCRFNFVRLFHVSFVVQVVEFWTEGKRVIISRKCYGLQLELPTWYKCSCFEAIYTNSSTKLTLQKL